MKIIDNFLPQIYFNNLKETVLSNNFDWYYQNCKVEKNDGGQQFTHVFFNENKKQSNSLYLLEPILKQLNIKQIIRAKINFTHKDNSIKQFKYHIDTNTNCTTSIIYLNTNNGKTIFKNGKEIESVANRLVEFESSLEHTATTHTDTSYRLVLNLNYL
jgi:hypothetical protein